MILYMPFVLSAKRFTMYKSKAKQHKATRGAQVGSLLLLLGTCHCAHRSPGYNKKGHILCTVWQVGRLVARRYLPPRKVFPKGPKKEDLRQKNRLSREIHLCH